MGVHNARPIMQLVLQVQTNCPAAAVTSRQLILWVPLMASTWLIDAYITCTVCFHLRHTCKQTAELIDWKCCKSQLIAQTRYPTQLISVIQGRPQNFFQGGSKVVLIVQGGSKPKNFAEYVGQNPNFFCLYGQNKKICRARGGQVTLFDTACGRPW